MPEDRRYGVAWSLPSRWRETGYSPTCGTRRSHRAVGCARSGPYPLRRAIRAYDIRREALLTCCAIYRAATNRSCALHASLPTLLSWSSLPTLPEASTCEPSLSCCANAAARAMRASVLLLS